MGFYLGLAKLALAVMIFTLIAAPTLAFGRFKKLMKEVCLLAVFFAFGAACFFVSDANEDPLLRSVGKQAVIDGVVCSIEKKDAESYRMTVKTYEEKSKVLINVYGDLGVEKYGDIAGRGVLISGVPELPAERRNPNAFDYRLYLKTKGISVLMNVAPYDIEISSDVKDGFINALSNIKRGFERKALEHMDPRNAGLMMGMMFGDKNTIDDDVYEMFQKNGTAHILAVSGIHVGIIYALMGRILKPRRNIPLNAALLFTLFAYAALASFAPSVIRAGGMICVHILSKLLCMRYDMLCAAAGIAIPMMLINPLAIFDLGFQLSFLAIVTIAIALPAMRRLHDSGITAAFALQAGLAPVTAYHFNYFSVAAFFINAPVILIAGAIIPLGVVMLPLSLLPGPFFSAAAGFMGALCETLYRLNELTYSKAGLFFDVVSPPLWSLFLFYGFFFFACSEAGWILYKRNSKKKIIAIISVIIAASIAFAFPVRDGLGGARLIFVDVGQGDCLHIRTPEGKNILIDGGGSLNFDVGKKILKPYLLKNGVGKIDMVFVSHRHLDHYGGIVSLAKDFKIGKLCLYEANSVIEPEILKETGLRNDQIAYLSKGQKIILGKDVFIEVLYPGKKTAEDYRELTLESSDENDISLIMKVNYDGFSVLMTGDIDSEGESSLISACSPDKDMLKCDLLKVPHHGSKYSSSDEFVSLTDPDFAVFQVGKNGFGHPAEETLKKYRDIGAAIYRNDMQGAIAVFLKGGDPVIKTCIETFIN